MKNLLIKKINLFQNLLVFIFAIFIIFFSLELMTKIFLDDGERFEFEMAKYAKNLKIVDNNNQEIVGHLPNKKIKVMGVNIFTDNNGFRILNPNLKNSNLNLKKKKIIMLGDSVTFGFGSSKTFTNFLEEKFSNYIFYNTGVGNTNTIMQIDRFFYKLKDLNSDIIILNFFINDLEKIKYQEKKWYQNLYLYNFVKYNSNIVLIKLGIKKNNENFYKKIFEDKNYLKLTLKKIDQLNSYALTENKIFFVNIIPDFRYLNDYPFMEQENELIEYFLKKKIKFIQGIHFLKNRKSEEYWVSKNDAHPNEMGHKLISIYLKDFISSEIIGSL